MKNPTTVEGSTGPRSVLRLKLAFTFLFTLITVSVGLYVCADDSYVQKEREKMFALQKQGVPAQELVFEGFDSAPTAHREFLEYYQREIRPTQLKLAKLGFDGTWAKVAVDRALYLTDAEKAEWDKIRVDTENESDRISNGDEWKKKVKRWAELAQGLPGNVAKYARDHWKEIELASFDESQLPTLEKITSLMLDVDNAANTSEFAKNIGAVEEEIFKTAVAYKKGEISFETAWKKIEAERARGQMGQSRDIADKVRAQLNEAAKLRTQLAQSKGYKSWSEYELATQASHYEEPLKSVPGRIAFLESVLSKTEALYREIMKKMISSEPGASLETLRESQVLLLQPETETIMGPYVPRENVDKIWEKTLQESGFNPEGIRHIYRDVMPRPNKYTHAYMTELFLTAPKVFRVLANSLDLKLAPYSLKDWNPAEVFIIQNFFSDSVDAINTAFHEGGHAIHHVHEENSFQEDWAYAYVEIHSMTMEEFFSDPTFILARMKNRDGKAPSPEEVEKYILHAAVNEITQFRILAGRALFELKLWNADYTKSGEEDFVTRAVRLYGETISKATLAHGTEGHGVDSTGRGPFNAPHFREGTVNYIGYVGAGISAKLTAQTLLDQFEKETGRRTFLEQPTLAKKLIDGYYRRGFAEPFPKPVERFTGKPFSLDHYLAILKAAVAKYLHQGTQACNGNL